MSPGKRQARTGAQRDEKTAVYGPLPDFGPFLGNLRGGAALRTAAGSAHPRRRVAML